MATALWNTSIEEPEGRDAHRLGIRAMADVKGEESIMKATCRSRRHRLLGGAAMITMNLGAMATPAMAQTTAPASTESSTAAGNQRWAQDSVGVQDIIVTAERVESNVQRTAASITVEKGQDLLQRGKFSLRNILETVPGVSGGESDGISNEPVGSDSPAAGITIRGISSNGATSGQTLSGVPATALYVDDVYNGIGGSYDIDRVEVLRGPQGTLYGRSATAGVVSIHTRNPDLSSPGVNASVEGGSLNLFHASGALNLPVVTDQLAIRIAANHYERDGADVDRGYGASKVDEVRAKILYRPSDSFSLLVGGSLQNKTLYNGGVVSNLVAPDKVQFQNYSTGSAQLKSREAWAEANLDLGSVHLTYLPSYRSFDQNATVYVVGPGGNTIRQVVRTPHDDFMTHELRIASAKSSRIKWQAGAFYYYNKVSSDNRNLWDSSGGLIFDAAVQRKTKDFGLFAETTVPLTDHLRMTGGIRYDKTTVNTAETYTSNTRSFCNTPLGMFMNCEVGGVNATNAGLPEAPAGITLSGDTGRREFKNVTYKARAEFDATPNNMLYASVSTSFLPGDVQVATGAGGVPVAYPYQSENLTAFEVGSKNRFFHRRLQVNLGLFHYSYGGFQTVVQLDARDPSSAVLFNVPLRMSGVELDSQFQLTHNDRIGVSGSAITSAFHDFSALFARTVAERRMWGYAPSTATGFYEHIFNLPGGSNVTFHGEALWRSAYDVVATTPELAAQGGRDYVRQNGVVLGNLNLTWTSANDHFSISAYVRNVGNTRYKTYVNLQSITPLQATATLSDPRTFGAVVGVKF